MYANGEGVEKDPVQAAIFYTRAAMKGNTAAQFNLAALFFGGDGVPKDFVQAHVWWNISGANGDKVAKLKLATLEPQMTPEQKAQAMTAAREIFARIQKIKASPEKRDAAESKPENTLASRSEGSRPSAIAPVSPPLTPKKLTKKPVRPAILAENRFGTTNIGPTAVSALWSNYGSYLRRTIESVQIQWETFLGESKVYPGSGSTVTVKFIMNSRGQITKIVSHQSTASDEATRACISAITKPGPYGEWTDDMKAVLGEQQELTFTFYYQ